MDAIVNKHPRDEKKVPVTGAPGGDSHINVTGMLVVSLWGVWDGKSLYLPIQM